MKHTLYLLIVTLLALLLAGSAAAETNGPPAASSYTGTLTVIVGDPMPTADEPMTPIPPIFTLHLADGRELRLLPGAAGENELLRLAGQRVSVTLPAAEAESALAAADPAAPGVAVASVGLAPGAVMVSPEVSGNTNWMTIACKFADVADEPKPLSYFTNMLRNGDVLNDYWKQASYDKINLRGSTAVGWYTLPQPLAYYRVSDTQFKLAEMFADCTALADANVNFGQFYGINLMFNAAIGCCAWGGYQQYTLDGVTKNWPTTWMPDWGYLDIGYLQHEMTHAYGILWHSYAGYEPYTDPWDVVSCPIYCARHGTLPHPSYGFVGQHTQAFHRAYLGWITDDRIITLDEPGPHTITLERTTLPNATGYLLAILPIDGSSSHYYVLEARQQIGYDTKLIGQSITIHEIGGTPNPVQLMDPHTGYGQGHQMWPVGATWVAPQGGFTVHVDAATYTGFVVTVTGGYETETVVLSPTADTYVDINLPDTNFGNSPTLKVWGGFSDHCATHGNPCKATFYRFDPSQMPSLIAQARLRLTVVEGAMTGWLPSAHTYLLNYNGTNTPWEENGLTWNNLERDYWPLPYLQRPTAQGANWLEWDFAGTLSVLGVDSVRSLMVDNAVDYAFSSREGANPPQLIIDYLVPPDETTTTTFPPTNDATVSQAKPKLISGTKPTLQVKDAAKDFNSYVKFNVTGLTGAVQSATLRLWVTNGGPDGGRVYSTSPFYPNTTTQWLETGLKWSNAPAISGTALDSAGAVVAGHWLELDVTSAVVAATANGNGRASFALTNDSTNLVNYSSKEGPHAPELIVITN